MAFDLKERIVFGRSIVSPALFEGPEISREHFALFLRQDTVCIEDLSANGTLVNEESLPQGRSRELSRGDIIGLPGYEIDLDFPHSPVEFVQNMPTAAAGGATHNKPSALRFFNAWELIVIGSAIASFTLILYYITQ